MLKLLEWDSEFFGFPVANLEPHYVEVAREEIEQFFDRYPQGLVQCCCQATDVTRINLLESYGFFFADLRQSFTLTIDGIQGQIESSNVQVAAADDLSRLFHISRGLFGKSRFYNPIFDSDKADRLFHIWLAKSVVGQFDDVCLKVLNDGLNVGFCTLRFESRDIARIGLIGVDQSFHHLGIGSRLMKGVKSYLQSCSIGFIVVSTQGTNYAAHNFFVKCGFLLTSTEVWLYRTNRRTALNDNSGRQ
jgi:dTDP-4-amino-4,6-dideoxy-D-galactose acyltransferase